MADPLSIAAGIAGLLTLAAGVKTTLTTAYKSFKDAPSDLDNLSNEVEAIITILSELKDCIEQSSDESRVWLHQHNIRGAIENLRTSLAKIQATMDRFKYADKGKRRWKRRRWVFEENEVLKIISSLQRQKLTLILALSVMGMKSDHHLEIFLKNMDGSFGNAFTSMREIKTSVGIMQGVLLQMLGQQTEIGLQMSAFHRNVHGQINDVLEMRSKSMPPVSGSDDQGEIPGRKRSITKLKFLKQFTSWGTFEAAYGPLAYFEISRFSRSQGFGMRATYTPPAWFFQMAFNLSFGLGIYPRLRIYFGIAVAAVVPFESAIFTCAYQGDLTRAQGLFSSGKATPTDRSVEGFTALHYFEPNPDLYDDIQGAAFKLDVEMCKFLISEGADQTAGLRSSLLELELSPVACVRLWNSRSNSRAKQETLEVLGCSNTQLPHFYLKKKSFLQLLLPPEEVYCPQGDFTIEDLQTLDSNLKDDQGRTFLIWASEFGNVDAARSLIKSGMKVNVVDNVGWSALHFACYNGRRECIKELLTAGADWTLKDMWGKSPGDIAADRGKGRIWKAALDQFLAQRAEMVKRLRENMRRELEDLDYDTHLLWNHFSESEHKVESSSEETFLHVPGIAPIEAHNMDFSSLFIVIALLILLFSIIVS